MRLGYHLPRRSTVSDGTSERAVATVLALVALPVAFVGALVAVGALATSGPVGAGVAALALFATPVVLPWVAVRGVVAAVERGQAR